jgi:hypothetical protein
MVIALPARNQPAAAAHAQPPAGSDVDSERPRRSRYHVAIKHAQRSASCPCRRHGGHFSDRKTARRAASRTSGTSAAPGGCTAGGSCAARGTCRSRGRPACRRTACGATGTARSAPGHGRAAGGATSAPRRAATTRATFRRARAFRRRAWAGRRKWAEGADGRRSDTRETGGRSRRRCPARIARTSGTTAPRVAPTVHATVRAAAGSSRSDCAGPKQIGPAGPGNATSNLQPNRCRPHLAQ